LLWVAASSGKASSQRWRIVTSLPGIGTTLAAEFLAHAGPLTTYPSAAALAAHAGLAHRAPLVATAEGGHAGRVSLIFDDVRDVCSPAEVTPGQPAPTWVTAAARGRKRGSCARAVALDWANGGPGAAGGRGPLPAT
jgi:hypothetical protein